jgi:hypothetical protein
MGPHQGRTMMPPWQSRLPGRVTLNNDRPRRTTESVAMMPSTLASVSLQRISATVTFLLCSETDISLVATSRARAWQLIPMPGNYDPYRQVWAWPRHPRLSLPRSHKDVDAGPSPGMTV